MGKLPEATLARLGVFVADNLGLNFPEGRARDLERGILAACGEFGYDEPARCVEWLLSAPLTKGQVEVLAGHLTVGETYFFRDKAALTALERDVLPGLISSRRERGRRLRVWVAGCSTGEEAYSMAIMLHRLIPDLAGWGVTVVGTDINPRALGKATDGCYTEWSFRGVPGWIRGRYFRDRGGCSEVAPEIRSMVEFSYHNMADDAYPSFVSAVAAVDVVLCCNVLMYFTPEKAAVAANNFSRALVEDGWLVMGPNDPAHLLPAGLTRIDPHVPLFRKGPTPAVEPAAWMLYEPPPLPPAMPPSHPAEPPGPARETPPDPPARTPYEQAAALYGRGLYAEALEKLAGEAGADALALAAKAYANLGRLDEADEACVKAAEMEKLDPAHHYLHAMILREKGDLEGAADALRRVLYIDHGFVLAHVALGNLALRRGARGEATRHFANAARLLSAYPPDEVPPGPDGVAAGRLLEVVTAAMRGGRGHGTKAA